MSDASERHANAEQREYWNTDEGAVWVTGQDRYDEMLAPFTAALLDAAAPDGRSDTVLDVGLRYRRHHDRGAARLVPTDAPPARHLRADDRRRPAPRRTRGRDQRASRSTTRRSTTRCRVDLVVSRFGVMFFEDPVAAFTNVRRAIAPGGRLAFVCWQPLLANEWMTVPALAAAEHVPLPDPPRPGHTGTVLPRRRRPSRGQCSTGPASPTSPSTPFDDDAPARRRGDARGRSDFLRRTGMGRTLLGDGARRRRGPGA